MNFKIEKKLAILSRSDRSWEGSKTWEGRGRKNKEKNAPSEIDSKVRPTAPTDEVAIGFPNGLQISAAGKWAIIGLSLTYVVVFCVDRFVKLCMCVVTRLNARPADQAQR